MSKFRCLAITSPSFSKHPLLVSEAYKLAEKVMVSDSGIKWTEDTLVQWINSNHADAVILGTDPFHKDVIAKLTHVKAVGKYGVGCDNVDIAALAERGIHFGWEGGVNRRSVTELALGFMLGHCRNIFYSIDKMQKGHWDKNGGIQLTERRVGIVGLGFIGTDLARILKAIGCDVFYHDVVDKSAIARELGISGLSYDDLVRTSDILTFHVPGGAATRNMFSNKQIEIAKKNLLVVNTARGHVVDFDAVTSAVKNRQIAGYASDVFPNEPLNAHEYSISTGFYFTPHIGGNSEEAVLAMGRSAIKGLEVFLKNLSVHI